MKLKEKLALDFYRSKQGQDLNGLGWEEVAIQIYLAGFDKARELCDEKIANLMWAAQDFRVYRIGEEDIE